MSYNLLIFQLYVISSRCVSSKLVCIAKSRDTKCRTFRPYNNWLWFFASSCSSHCHSALIRPQHQVSVEHQECFLATSTFRLQCLRLRLGWFCRNRVARYQPPSSYRHHGPAIRDRWMFGVNLFIVMVHIKIKTNTKLRFFYNSHFFLFRPFKVWIL
jgi:hypothetical protein